MSGLRTRSSIVSPSKFLSPHAVAAASPSKNNNNHHHYGKDDDKRNGGGLLVLINQLAFSASHHIHQFALSTSRRRLSVLFFLVVMSLYIFSSTENNLKSQQHHQGSSSASSSSSFNVVSEGVLRGLGINGSTQQQQQRQHPRILRLSIDGTVENDNAQGQEKNKPVTIFLKHEQRKVKPMTPVQEENSASEDEIDAEWVHELPDDLETKECKAQYAWQLDSKSTCNSMHEVDLNDFYGAHFDVRNKKSLEENNDETVVRERVRLIAGGGWRSVWSFINEGEDDVKKDDPLDQRFVMKTLLYRKEATPRNIDRHRRDAMAMERLTSSPNIVDIYSFCGNSGVFEFANGGDLNHATDALKDAWNAHGVLTRQERLSRLHMGVQAAMGLADLHNFDKEGKPSVAHTDISAGQFVKINDRYRLNDFNRARFIAQNRTNPENLCTFHIGGNPGRHRSPEEYKYLPETEKVDVYSLGNVMYGLLTFESPFAGLTSKEAQKMVKKGKKPNPKGGPRMYGQSSTLPLFESKDPIDVALRKAMDMCLVYNVTERATARQVETFLKERLEEIDPGRLKAWGVKSTS